MVAQVLQKIKYYGFTPKQQQAFLEDIATLIEDGVQAKQAIEVIAKEGLGLSVDVANSILAKLASGQYLADGLEGWYPYHIVELVRAGEQSGNLAKTMKVASETLSQKNLTIASIISSLTYPIIVICAGLAVSVFINHSIFDNYRAITPIAHWPKIGRDVAAMANFVQYWWWLVLIFILVSIVAMVKFLRNYVGDGREYIDNLPLISLYRKIIAARFMQTLGILISNGVVFKKALHILQYSASPYLAWHLLSMEYRLGAGKENIAEVLDTGLIQPRDLMRLKITAYGRGFEYALMRQGKHSMEQGIKAIQTTGRITGGAFLGMAAILAIFLILGIYTVGSSLVSY